MAKKDDFFGCLKTIKVSSRISLQSMAILKKYI